MIKAAIVGISGYSGGACLELLLKHPEVRVTYVSANNSIGPIGDLWPSLSHIKSLHSEKYNAKKAIKKSDVMFLAVPHGVSMSMVPELLKANRTVIDLSGDYRLNKLSSYTKWYGKKHSDKTNFKKAIYGLPELYREDIKKSKFIANPGCYPTAAILGLAPITSSFTNKINSIIIDAKSGVSGAGRKAALSLNYCETNESIKAYKVLKHQHAPEINLYLSKISGEDIDVDFVPHLIPMERGILETIYVKFNKEISLKQIHQIYKRFYKLEKFVRLLDLGKQPETKNVSKTNYCDIGLSINKNNSLLVITSAIDNLYKGAASQAVQNMNIIYGFNEGLGIS